MKLKIEKEALLKTLNITSKAVPNRTPMPILECILIDAAGAEIKMSGNDMELGIEAICKGDVEEHGLVAVEAKIFMDIVKKLPDSIVKIETNESGMQIKCGKSKFKLQTRNGEDFVRVPFIEADNTMELSQGALKALITQTAFSAATDNSNKTLTGMYLELKDNIISTTCIDGHRIAIRKKVLSKVYSEQSAIIPAKTMVEISKILSDDSEAIVSMGLSSSHVVLTFDGITIVSRLINGKYFEVDKMISNSYELALKLNREALASTMDRSSLFVNEGSKKPVVFNIKNGVDVVNLSVSGTIGSLNEDLDAKIDGNTDMKIGFNPRFIIDVLKVISEEEVSLYISNSKAPMIIRDDKDTFTYVVLPVNLA